MKIYFFKKKKNNKYNVTTYKANASRWKDVEWWVNPYKGVDEHEPP